MLSVFIRSPKMLICLFAFVAMRYCVNPAVASPVPSSSISTDGNPGFDPTIGIPLPHQSVSLKRIPAHWIWLGPVVGDQQVDVRKTIELSKRPYSAIATITADDAFTLFVNGVKVGGTTPVELGWANAHQYDVATYLHSGKNVIGIEGVNYGGGAGILFSLDVNNKSALVSDVSWKGVLGLDPPRGWLDTDFDDSSWQAATDEGKVGTSIWGDGVSNWPENESYMAHVVEKPIAVEALSGQLSVIGGQSLIDKSSPVSVVLNPTKSDQPGESTLLLDFGRELSGRLEVAGTDGATIVVHTGETRAYCLASPPNAQIQSIDNSGPWSLTFNGSETQTTPYTAFRFALITVKGSGPVTLTKADCDFKYYPVTYQGAFSCSDPVLTRIWYAGAYTAHLCMQEDIWDAPKRDRGLWIGDLHVTGETINNAFGDRFLMEHTIAGGRAQAQNGLLITQLPTNDINGIPGYTAAWFGVLADFYRHSGDTAFLQSQHDAIVSMLAYQQTEFDSHNLFVNPANRWDFCDWVPSLIQHTPQTLATTDLFDIYGVRQAVFLLRALGDNSNAAKYESWADALTQAARTAFAGPSKQTYGTLVQENAMAIFSDVATPAEKAAIYQDILKPGSASWTPGTSGDLVQREVISPYYGNYVLKAYGKLGKYQVGIDLIRRYWGSMLDRGTTTFWEQYDPSYPTDMAVIHDMNPYLSLCHGWATGPTSFLSESILGIEPTSGSFDTAKIEPNLGDLSWVKGAVPTPHGVIHLAVRKVGAGLTYYLILPKGINATVVFPTRVINIDKPGFYMLTG